jgi:hypothetical protein
MQISERVRLVGSGELGFQTSHPLDCNVFLLNGGTEHDPDRRREWCRTRTDSRPFLPGPSRRRGDLSG